MISVFAAVRRPAVVGVLMLTTACYSWQDTEITRLTSEDRLERARIELRDGTRHVLWEPRIIQGDSVFGYAEAADSAAWARPAADVRAVQVRGVDPIITSGVVVGVMTVGLVLACTSTGCIPF
jgi:hypothetical protein